MPNLRLPDRTVRGTAVVARFRPVRPVLWVVALGFALWRWVLPRLTRMSRGGWVAFAVVPYGIYLGAQPGKAPAFVPWHQVAGVVLREWYTGNETRERHRGVAPGVPVVRHDRG